MTALGAVLTYLTHSVWGPWLCARTGWLSLYMDIAPYFLAASYCCVGVFHFVFTKLLERMYPHKVRTPCCTVRWCALAAAAQQENLHPVNRGDGNFSAQARYSLGCLSCCVCLQGAWGFWYLPGTGPFHIVSTGAAQIAGGLGVLLSRWAPPAWPIPYWVEPISALGLLVLTVVVSPSNIYMWTHNASPLDRSLDGQPDAPFPAWAHVLRGALQVMMLATWVGLARARWPLLGYWGTLA